MRYVLILLMLMMLTACGGGESPATEDANAQPTPFVPEGTQVGVNPVSDENVPIIETLIAEEIAAQNPQPYIPPLPTVGEGGLPVPPIGTLVASQTENVQAGVPFDYIYMTQIGGVNNENITIQIYKDGRVTINDRTGVISQENIEELIRHIDALNFFGLQGTFMGPAPRPNEYVYQIFIKRGGQERLLNAQDGYMPIEFASFLGYVRAVAESLSPLPPTSTPTP